MTVSDFPAEADWTDLRPFDEQAGTADDTYFAGRQPTEAECGGWPDPTLWEGCPLVEPPDLADGPEPLIPA